MRSAGVGWLRVPLGARSRPPERCPGAHVIRPAISVARIVSKPRPVERLESLWGRTVRGISTAMDRRAGMAELAVAADLKSAAGKPAWGFESLSRHYPPFEI